MPENMPDLGVLRERFRDYNISAVSRATGLHYSVIYEFVNARVNPKYETVRRLVKYLADQEAPLND